MFAVCVSPHLCIALRSHKTNNQQLQEQVSIYNSYSILGTHLFSASSHEDYVRNIIAKFGRGWMSLDHARRMYSSYFVANSLSFGNSFAGSVLCIEIIYDGHHLVQISLLIAMPIGRA